MLLRVGIAHASCDMIKLFYVQRKGENTWIRLLETCATPSGC